MSMCALCYVQAFRGATFSSMLKDGLVLITDLQQTCSKHLERGWKKKPNQQTPNQHGSSTANVLRCGQYFEVLPPNKD